MPFAHVTLLAGRPPEQLHRLVAALSDCFAHVLDAPRERLRVWISEISPDGWGWRGQAFTLAFDQGLPPTAETPILQLSLLQGRPVAQHHALIAAMTDVLEQVLAVERSGIRVAISEINPDLFGIAGVPASVARKAEIEARRQG